MVSLGVAMNLLTNILSSINTNLLVSVSAIIESGNSFSWYHQEMGRGLRVNVVEGHTLQTQIKNNQNSYWLKLTLNFDQLEELPHKQTKNTYLIIFVDEFARDFTTQYLSKYGFSSRFRSPCFLHFSHNSPHKKTRMRTISSELLPWKRYTWLA